MGGIYRFKAIKTPPEHIVITVFIAFYIFITNSDSNRRIPSMYSRAAECLLINLHIHTKHQCICICNICIMYGDISLPMTGSEDSTPIFLFSRRVTVEISLETSYSTNS